MKTLFLEIHVEVVMQASYLNKLRRGFCHLRLTSKYYAIIMYTVQCNTGAGPPALFFSALRFSTDFDRGTYKLSIHEWWHPSLLGYYPLMNHPYITVY